MRKKKAEQISEIGSIQEGTANSLADLSDKADQASEDLKFGKDLKLHDVAPRLADAIIKGGLSVKKSFDAVAAHEAVLEAEEGVAAKLSKVSEMSWEKKYDSLVGLKASLKQSADNLASKISDPEIRARTLKTFNSFAASKVNSLTQDTMREMQKVAKTTMENVSNAVHNTAQDNPNDVKKVQETVEDGMSLVAPFLQTDDMKQAFGKKILNDRQWGLIQGAMARENTAAVASMLKQQVNDFSYEDGKYVQKDKKLGAAQILTKPQFDQVKRWLNKQNDPKTKISKLTREVKYAGFTGEFEKIDLIATDTNNQLAPVASKISRVYKARVAQGNVGNVFTEPFIQEVKKDLDKKGIMGADQGAFIGALRNANSPKKDQYSVVSNVASSLGKEVSEEDIYRISGQPMSTPDLNNLLGAMSLTKAHSPEDIGSFLGKHMKQRFPGNPAAQTQATSFALDQYVKAGKSEKEKRNRGAVSTVIGLARQQGPDYILGVDIQDASNFISDPKNAKFKIPSNFDAHKGEQYSILRRNLGQKQADDIYYLLKVEAWRQISASPNADDEWTASQDRRNNARANLEKMAKRFNEKHFDLKDSRWSRNTNVNNASGRYGEAFSFSMLEKSAVQGADGNIDRTHKLIADPLANKETANALKASLPKKQYDSLAAGTHRLFLERNPNSQIVHIKMREMGEDANPLTSIDLIGKDGKPVRLNQLDILENGTTAIMHKIQGTRPKTYEELKKENPYGASYVESLTLE